MHDYNVLCKLTKVVNLYCFVFFERIFFEILYKMFVRIKDTL